MKKKIFAKSPHLNKDQIKDYLGDHLAREDQHQVENHLLDCELCSAAVEGFSAHYDFEKDQHLQQLKNAFDQPATAKEIQLAPLRRNYRLINRIAAAAAITFVVLASWLYWNNQSDERLFARFYEPYQSESLALRGEEASQLDPMLERALEEYRAEEYTSSISLLENYLEKDAENILALFHAGLASLEAGQSRKAIQYLELVRLNDEQYYEDASWYLALAHLKLKEEGKAKNILKDLAKIENGFYDQQVGDLIESLNE